MRFRIASMRFRIASMSGSLESEGSSKVVSVNPADTTVSPMPTAEPAGLANAAVVAARAATSAAIAIAVATVKPVPLISMSAFAKFAVKLPALSNRPTIGTDIETASIRARPAFAAPIAADATSANELTFCRVNAADATSTGAKCKLARVCAALVAVEY